MATGTDGSAAHDILLDFGTLSQHGACWHYVWQAYASAGASTDAPSTPTAYQGWQATQGQHPGDWNPPKGAAIWLGRRYDGNMDGDVFIAGAYDGDHSATDQPVYGCTGLTSIQARLGPVRPRISGLVRPRPGLPDRDWEGPRRAPSGRFFRATR